MLRPRPRLEAETDYPFPNIEGASPEGIVCYGGNLSPGMLLSAYRRGIFPWYSEGEPILWWSPDPRFVVLPDTLHIPARAARTLRKGKFTLSLDRAFPKVITACAAAPRKGQDGTWITPEMIDAYVELKSQGFAHSVEVWDDGELAGGLYGVSLGSAFFGESMFTRASGASRFGFLSFSAALFAEGFDFIDSQVHTDYLASMGGLCIPRKEYLRRLGKALEKPDRRGLWHLSFPEFETRAFS
ncbi:MAG: leucyl/phenylalanyl-tRNA--protein transferase [Spirochaetes bacterium]|nr:leucyl/phenylalanyl-tRNA--protein transferase [Spirochaetota bacterium]